MITEKIREELYSLRDGKYREMQIRILPTVKPESILGVWTPELRRMAVKYAGAEGIGTFLNDLPHRYFEENQLHAFILSGFRDYAECIQALNRFLPFVDNWATVTRCRRKCSGSTAKNCCAASGAGLIPERPIRSDSVSGC